MNKYLRQNWRIMNSVRWTPIDLEQPDNLDNINAWCEQVYNHLVNDEIKRHKHYVVKGKKGFNVSVVSDDENVYIVQVIRNEYNTDDTMIFGAKYTENNLNDFLSIAKFIRYNIKDIIGHSKEGAVELNKLASAMEIKEKIDGVA